MNKKTIKTLNIGCLIVMALLIFSIFSYGIANINSDTATATLLSRTQLKYKQLFPTNWNYGNGEIWVFGLNLFVMPFSVIFQNQAIARMCGSALALILFTTLLVYMYRKYIDNIGYTFILLFFILCLTPNYEFILYQASSVPGLFLLLIDLILSYKSIIENKIEYFILLIILVFINSISSLRYLAENVIPIISGLSVFAFFEYKMNRITITNVKKIILRLLILILFSVFGYAFHTYLGDKLLMNNTWLGSFALYLNPKALFVNLAKTIKNYLIIFGVTFRDVHLVLLFKSIIAAIFAIIIFAIIPILSIKNINRFNKFQRYIIILSIAHNVVMTSIIVLCDKTYNYRYLISSVFLFCVITSIYIFTFYKSIYTKIVLFIAVIFSVNLIFKSNNFLNVYEKKNSFNSQLINL